MASFKTAPRVRETSSTTGTGTYALAGAPTGFQPFSVMGAGNLCPYFASDGVNWEEGIGTISVGPAQLARTIVLGSSNAGAAVNWGVGTRTLRCGAISGLALPRYLSKSVAGAAGTTVLTQDEQRRTVLELTGALTGARTIEVDATPWVFVVYNNTTGAFSLTVKVSGQTGVVVPQGRRAVLYCDGVDVRSAVTSVPNGSEFASGTALLFNQTAAPTGWTKSATHNDKALRVVSGTVGSGGATAFSSVFGAGKVTGGTATTIAQTAPHTHPVPLSNGSVGGSTNAAGGGSPVATNPPSGSTGGGSSHDHTLSLDLQYVDVIIATKD